MSIDRNMSKESLLELIKDGRADDRIDEFIDNYDLSLSNAALATIAIIDNETNSLMDRMAERVAQIESTEKAAYDSGMGDCQEQIYYLTKQLVKSKQVTRYMSAAMGLGMAFGCVVYLVIRDRKVK